MSSKKYRINKYLLLIILAIFLLLTVPHMASMQATDRIEARYLMRAGDAIFGNDFYFYTADPNPLPQ